MATPEPHVEYLPKAAREIRKLERAERRRIRDAIVALAAGAENLDVKPLAGHAPWLRLRTGDWRVIYRPVEGGGWLVARVVNRRELERAVRALQD